MNESAKQNWVFEWDANSKIKRRKIYVSEQSNQIAHFQLAWLRNESNKELGIEREGDKDKENER